MTYMDRAYEKEFSRSTKKHSNRVMGYIILCHNTVCCSIGDWQSLQKKTLGQAENTILSNVC